MILVNTPGSGAHVWWPLDHAEWHGFTPTDLVFPAFLCAMGMAMGLAFPRRMDSAFWARVARRTALLILIGWAWQMLARPGLETFRLMGVLPRLGLCYGLAALALAATSRRGANDRASLRAPALAALTALILIGYWAAMMLIPVPGHGAGDLSPEGNLAGFVDRAILGTQHLWRFGTDAAGNIVYDPEGLLSTLAALANVLLGVLAALLWKRDPSNGPRNLALAGIALAAIGLALAPWFPLNKKLWTSSFALFTSGLSGVLLALCLLVARTRIRRWLVPLDILGMNAILGYIVSLLIGLAGMRWGFQAIGFDLIASAVPDPYLASFLYALAVLALVTLLLFPLHRRGIHLRL